MFVVAICKLAAKDDDAAHLARETNTAVYDARLKLAQPIPIIVLRTAVKDEALRLLASLRERGHDVIACDEDAVPRPLPVRAFELTESAFVRRGDTLETLPYGDVVALVRASRTLHTETIERVTERKLRPAAAIISGGLILSKKVTRNEKSVTHDREDLLYVFSRSGVGWLVSEQSTIYASLADVAPTQRENFMRVVSELRARAPGAAFDDRLLAHRALEGRDIDLRAHILAIAAQRSVLVCDVPPAADPSTTSLPNASKT